MRRTTPKPFKADVTHGYFTDGKSIITLDDVAQGLQDWLRFLRSNSYKVDQLATGIKEKDKWTT